MTARAILAALLALAATRAEAGDPAVGRGRTRHALALGWHGTTFFNDEGNQYTFHSAGLGYLGSFGSNRPFVHATWLLPLQARQDGAVYRTGAYYHRRTGGDLLLGWQWRRRAPRGVEAEAGPGLHATALWLPGRPGYRDFAALPLGLGGAGQLRWVAGSAFSRPLVLAAFASVAYDVFDPLHAHDLAHGFAFRLGVAGGLGRSP